MSDSLSFDLSVVPVLQAHDLGEQEAGRMQTWHDETRFRRGVLQRRSRIVARFLKDPATLRRSAELQAPSFCDHVIELPAADAPIDAFGNVIARRVSTRRTELSGRLALFQISDLLDAAVRPNRWVESAAADAQFGLRPYPSAGALYPCDIFVIMADDEFAGLPLRYDGHRHALVDYGATRGDFRAIEMEDHAASPPCAIVITATLSRTTAKYGPRGYRFAMLEAGHIGQNLVLAATARGWPSLVSGSYFDAELERWLGLDGLDEVVLSTILIGGVPNDEM